jgi:hypothetical protein
MQGRVTVFMKTEIKGSKTRKQSDILTSIQNTNLIQQDLLSKCKRSNGWLSFIVNEF